MRHAWARRVGMVALVGAMVLVANPYTASAAKPVPPPPAPAPAVPRVLDLNDKLVGRVIGTYAPTVPPGSVAAQIVVPHVLLNISVPSIVVQVTSNSFLGSMPLWFTTSDCTGQPYFEWSRVNGPHVFPVVGVVNNNIYGAQPSSHIRITPLSTWDIVANNCSRDQSGSGLDVSIADLISDLHTIPAAIQVCLSLA